MNQQDDSLDAPFEFPTQILDGISESSPEGFFLFTINEQGEVEMFNRCFSDVLEVGLRTKAIKILSGLNAIEDEEIGQQLFELKYGVPMPKEGDEPEETEEEN